MRRFTDFCELMKPALIADFDGDGEPTLKNLI